MIGLLEGSERGGFRFGRADRPAGRVTVLHEIAGGDAGIAGEDGQRLPRNAKWFSGVAVDE
jgi:hypothetical protein